MTSLEKLFMSVLDRRHEVAGQFTGQVSSYDQALASQLLIHGIDPPLWLRCWGFDAQLARFQELKAGTLLLPPPHASVQTNVNVVNASEDPLEESLLRIQRSRSRQKALELRNSESGNSKRPTEEKEEGGIAPKFTGRMTRSRRKALELCNSESQKSKCPRVEEQRGEITHNFPGRITRSRIALQKVESPSGLSNKNVITQSEQLYCTTDSTKLTERRVVDKKSNLGKGSSAHVAVGQQSAQINMVVQCEKMDAFVIQQDQTDIGANVAVSEVVEMSQCIADPNPTMIHRVSLPGTLSHPGTCGISKQLCFGGMEECNLNPGCIHANGVENTDSWVRVGDGAESDPAQSLNRKLSFIEVDKRDDAYVENVVPDGELPLENKKALEHCNSLPSLNKCLTEDEKANKPSDGIDRSQTAPHKPYNLQEAVEKEKSAYFASRNSVATKSRSAAPLLQRATEHFKLDGYQISGKGNSSNRTSDFHIAVLEQPTGGEERMECSEASNFGRLHFLACGSEADLSISDAAGASLLITSCTPEIMPMENMCSLTENFVGSYKRENCDHSVIARSVIELNSGLSLPEKSGAKEFSEKSDLSAENLMAGKEAFLVAKPMDGVGVSSGYDGEVQDEKIDSIDAPALESTYPDIHLLRPSLKTIQYAECHEVDVDVDGMEVCRLNENTMHALEKVNCECSLETGSVARDKSAVFPEESITCQELEKNHILAADKLVVNTEVEEILVSVSENVESLHGPIEGEMDIHFELLEAPLMEKRASEIPLSKSHMDTRLSGIQKGLEFVDAEMFSVYQSSNHLFGREKKHHSVESDVVVTKLGNSQFKEEVDLQGKTGDASAHTLSCHEETCQETQAVDQRKEFLMVPSESQTERKLELDVSSSVNDNASRILLSEHSPKAKEHIDAVKYDFSTSGRCSLQQIGCALTSEMWNNSSEKHIAPESVRLLMGESLTSVENMPQRKEMQWSKGRVDDETLPIVPGNEAKKMLELVEGLSSGNRVSEICNSLAVEGCSEHYVVPYSDPLDQRKEFLKVSSESQAERKFELGVSSSSNDTASGILLSEHSPKAKEHIDAVNYDFSTSGKCNLQKISCPLTNGMCNNSSKMSFGPESVRLLMGESFTSVENMPQGKEVQRSEGRVDEETLPIIPGNEAKEMLELVEGLSSGNRVGDISTSLAVEEGSSEHNVVPYPVPLAADHLSTLQELSAKMLLENQLQSAPDLFSSDSIVAQDVINNDVKLDMRKSGSTPEAVQTLRPLAQYNMVNDVKLEMRKRTSTPETVQSLRPDGYFLRSSKSCGSTASIVGQDIVNNDVELDMRKSRSTSEAVQSSKPPAHDIMDNDVKLEMRKRTSTPEAVQSSRPDGYFLRSSKSCGTTSQQSSGQNNYKGAVTRRTSNIFDKEQVFLCFQRSLSHSSQNYEKTSPSSEADNGHPDAYNRIMREGFQRSAENSKDLSFEEDVQGRFASDTNKGKQICQASLDGLKDIELSSCSDGKEVKYPGVTEEISILRRLYQEGQSSLPDFQKDLASTKNPEAHASVESPEFTDFTFSLTPATGDDFSLNNVNLSCVASKSTNFLHNLLSSHQSLSTLHTLPESSLSLPPGPLQGRPYSYTPSIGKVCSKSVTSSLKEHVSISTELTCFPIDEDTCIPEEDEHLEGVIGPLESAASSSKKNASKKRSALVDVTLKHNKSSLNYEVGMHQNRESINSVRTDHNICSTKMGALKLEKSQDLTLVDERENHSCSLDANGVMRSSTSNIHGAERLNQSGKTSDVRSHRSYRKKGSKPNNIVSNVSSFIPLMQRKKNSGTVTGKRDIRVKALEAAEAAKRLEEERAIERKTKKEAARIERERMEQEKLRQAELLQKRKEEEKRKKEAEIAARKRQREEKEKEEKERKRRCIEGARKLQKEREEKLRAEKAEKEARRKAVEVEHKQQAVAEATKKQCKTEKVRQGAMCGSLAESQEMATTILTNNYEKTCDKNGDIMITIKPSNSEMAVDDPNEEGLSMTGACHAVESYEMSPYQCSDDEKDDDDSPSVKKYIPQWARENGVNKSLEILQFMDPEAVLLRGRCPRISEILVYEKK